MQAPPFLPLIIAHRGASAHAPENTLPAFALAREQGADMIELDVRRCADGALVAFHDATTERWDGQARLLSDCTLKEVRALDIGGTQVPTLEEVCIFARDHAVALNVELKQPGIAGAVTALLHTYGLDNQVIISSFQAAALHEAQTRAPHIRRGYLMGTPGWHPSTRLRELWPLPHLRRTGATAWHPAHNLPLLRRLLPLVRRAGYLVNVWTVDDPAHVRQLADWGATGIITNDPAGAAEALS
jgi:glycerophosphoryl diester phosphodiesterase